MLPMVQLLAALAAATADTAPGVPIPAPVVEALVAEVLVGEVQHLSAIAVSCLQVQDDVAPSPVLLSRLQALRPEHLLVPARECQARGDELVHSPTGRRAAWVRVYDYRPEGGGQARAVLSTWSDPRIEEPYPVTLKQVSGRWRVSVPREILIEFPAGFPVSPPTPPARLPVSPPARDG